MKENKYVTSGDLTIMLCHLGDRPIFVKLDTQDVERVKMFKWHGQRDNRSNKIYVTTGKVTNGKKKTILLHRYIMLPVEKGKVVDHINHNTLDNRRVNLRAVSHAENISNDEVNKPILKNVGDSWVIQDKQTGLELDSYSKKSIATKMLVFWDMAIYPHRTRYNSYDHIFEKQKGAS